MTRETHRIVMVVDGQNMDVSDVCDPVKMDRAAFQRWAGKAAFRLARRFSAAKLKKGPYTLTLTLGPMAGLEGSTYDFADMMGKGARPIDWQACGEGMGVAMWRGFNREAEAA